MDFLKEFPSSDFHPQVRKAGFWGATVFRALCRMSARHDLDGEIPPQYQDVDELADVLKADDYREDLEVGLAKCFAVGLLRKESLEEGHGEVWVIDGWGSLYTEKHKTNADRREAWREKKRLQREALFAKSSESKDCPPMSQMSPGTKNVPLTRRDVTRRDLTRPDETDVNTLSVVSTDPVAPTQPPLVESPSAADAVFQHWRAVMGKNARTALDKPRRRAIQARLDDGYSVEDLKQAVDGCAKTPHNMGQNDRGERYDDIALICRDAAHVDRFRANAQSPPIPHRRRGARVGAEDTNWTGVETAIGSGEELL